MTDSATVARASYEAYVRKDRAAIEALIDADFHFTSPLDNRIDRKTYFERCWPNSQQLTGFEFVHVFVHDVETVFVTYVGANTDGHRFRNTEILTVRNGKIVDVEVYFGWSIPHEVPEGGFKES
jgi:ketosteroid isomerase-like protein